jgi:hypothetical protein
MNAGERSGVAAQRNVCRSRGTMAFVKRPIYIISMLSKSFACPRIGLGLYLGTQQGHADLRRHTRLPWMWVGTLATDVGDSRLGVSRCSQPSPQAALLEETPGPHRQAATTFFGLANHGRWLLEGRSQEGTAVSFSFPSDGVARMTYKSNHYGSARCWALPTALATVERNGDQTLGQYI